MGVVIRILEFDIAYQCSEFGHPSFSRSADINR